MKDAGIIGFTIEGDYDSTRTYHFLNVVFYEDSSYVAKKDTTGNAPAEDNEFWHILAKGQVTGVSGVKGDKEEEYRTGDVNLTAENVGALPITGGTIVNNENPMLIFNRDKGAYTAIDFKNQYGYILTIEGSIGSNRNNRQLNIFARDWNKSLLRINEADRVIYDYKTQSEKKILVEGEALPATGGTLKSTDYFPLHLERTTEGTGCGLDFKGTDGAIGNIQMTYDTGSNNENEFRCFVKDDDKKDVGVLRVSRENRKIYCKETGGTKNIITDYEVPFRFGINSAGDYGYYRNDTGEFVKI